MARHRDAAATRRISRGPIIAVVSVLVVVLLVLGWFQVRQNVDEQSAVAAGQCVDGTSTLVVAADPDLAPALATVAEQWSATSPVVRDQCVQVQVTALGQDQVLAGLQGGWDTATLGPEPAVWVPADSTTAARLSTEGEVAGGAGPVSVATSPVRLAAPAAAADVLATTPPSWAQLPALQAADDGWAQLGAPQWGRLTLALPSGSVANQALLQAVAAAAGGGTPDPTQPAVAEALAAVRVGPDPQPATPAEALDALAATTDPAGTPYQLVPATEQQLAGREDLVSVAPGGATPVLDYPYVPISAPWVDDTQTRAASAFAEVLAEDAAQQVLTDAGFRTAASEATAEQPVTDPLAPADPATADAVLAASAAPEVAAVRSTVLLDVSGSMGFSAGDTTRLAATTAALGGRFAALPDSDEVGLWTFSRGLDGALPYRTLVPTAPLAGDGAQRSALTGALAGLVPESATSLYASAIAAFTAAAQTASPDAPDSVLVITDGPDDDGSTSAQDLLAAVTALGGTASGVRIDVITLGEADVAQLTEIATATGGTLTDVGDASSPALAAALEQYLP